MEITKKNLENPEKSWEFLDKSKRDAVHLETVFVGKGLYLPGWKWSEHVGKKTNKNSERHIGYIVSGQMMIKPQKGKEVLVKAGDFFEVGPNHDGWVVGDTPCVAFDFGNLN